MTLVCAPIKKWPEKRPVDLYEITEGPVKFLYDSTKKLSFVDVDWKEARTGDIASYHNFEMTPDLEVVLAQMKERHPRARYYKLATFARSTLDSLRMLHFQRRHPEVIGVCMGERGALTRILGPVMGCPIVYAPLTEEDKNSPGQLLWSELSLIYHFKSLTPENFICGLIGDPVRRSVGHLFHNPQFLYVKMKVEADELESFFALVEDLPFRGLSVTSPLKEKVIPYLARISSEAKAIGAVNTLVRGLSGWEGFNTDGKAAVDVLGEVRGKKVVVVGAGGAARAIVYELVKRGAVVTIVNRTKKKGQDLAIELGCVFAEEVPLCDILVNATSVSNSQYAPIVMDIATGGASFFEMYLNQAVAQQSYFNRAKTAGKEPEVAT
jgi:3-dehydroquinate dehydratase/shikimate dehydrogenase